MPKSISAYCPANGASAFAAWAAESIAVDAVVEERRGGGDDDEGGDHVGEDRAEHGLAGLALQVVLGRAPRSTVADCR